MWGVARCGVEVPRMRLQKARRAFGGSAVWLGALAVAAVGLAACSHPVDDTIEAYRSATGMNKNDPDPATAPFSPNMERAEAGGYPNLASVPALPTIVATVAERQKLTDSLTGQRTNLQANGGTASPGPVPPVPQIPPSLGVPEMASLPPVTPQSATQLPPLRPMDEPPVPPPLETTMQTPTIANLPGAEPSRPAPAAGTPSAMPSPAPSALPPATVQSGNPQPSLPVASLPEPKPSPEALSRPPTKMPPMAMTVASLDVSPGTAGLAPDTRTRLAEVVAQYQQKPRTVRVVAYAAPANGGAEQLNSFRAALDRAQIVAKELTDEGIPAKQIQTEASPSTPDAPTGRIDVQLMPVPPK
jgi:outer membrane protein OmpA-like peptidoglycan-associated protein